MLTEERHGGVNMSAHFIVEYGVAKLYDIITAYYTVEEKSQSVRMFAIKLEHRNDTATRIHFVERVKGMDNGVE